MINIYCIKVYNDTDYWNYLPVHPTIKISINLSISLTEFRDKSFAQVSLFSMHYHFRLMNLRKNIIFNLLKHIMCLYFTQVS